MPLLPSWQALPTVATPNNSAPDSKLVLENMLGADRLPLTMLVDAGADPGAKERDSPQALEVISKGFGVKL